MSSRIRENRFKKEGTIFDLSRVPEGFKLEKSLGRTKVYQKRNLIIIDYYSYHVQITERVCQNEKFSNFCISIVPGQLTLLYFENQVLIIGF